MFGRIGRTVSLGFILSALSSVSSIAFANDSSSVLNVKLDAPFTYTVVKGDTLWDISEIFLDSPWLWPRVWQNNPEIDNPHLIYPGDKISLVWRNGQPVLTRKSLVKLSPKVRVEEKQAIPTIKEEVVLPFLESDLLLSKGEIESAAQVLGSSDGERYLSQRALVYISGKHQQQKWGIYRPAMEFTRDSRAIVVLKKLADAELESYAEEVTGLKITKQVQEILADDIALPQSASLVMNNTFHPKPSPQGELANILGSIEGSKYAGKNQVVVIDRGSNDNLQQGSMFELYQAGARVEVKTKPEGKEQEKAIHLPDLKVGSLMVIRPYPYFSLALVTDSKQPITPATKAISPLTEK